MTRPISRLLTANAQPSFNTKFYGSQGTGSDTTTPSSLTLAFLEFDPQPSNATDNYTWATPIRVRLMDVHGNIFPVSGITVTLSVGSGSTVGTLGGTTAVQSGATGYCTFNNVAFDSSITTAGIVLVASSSGVPDEDSVAVTITPLPPSSGTYDTLFPNRPIAGSLQYGVTGSWRTVMDIRWGMQGLNGGVGTESSTYTAVPFSSTPNGSNMRNFGSDAPGGLWPGNYLSLESNSEITGNGLGSNVLAWTFPPGFPGGYAPSRIYGQSTATGPALGFSYTSTLRLRSWYVAHWVKMSSNFSPTGGAGYKGIFVQQSPNIGASGLNHFPASWDCPFGPGTNRMSFCVGLQAPFATLRTPTSGASSGLTLNIPGEQWFILESLLVCPWPSYASSNATVYIWTNGQFLWSTTTAREFNSDSSPYVNSWSIQNITGGGGTGPVSLQTMYMGPVLIMASGD